MSLNYSIAMMGNPLKKEEPKKAYAKAQTNGELSLKELSTLIASKCTVHQADVSAVLIATTECMLEGLKAGKQVNFGDLGAFRLQINSGGAPSADLIAGSPDDHRRLFRLIQETHELCGLEFTQLILEPGARWIHISYVPGNLRCQVIDKEKSPN